MIRTVSALNKGTPLLVNISVILSRVLDQQLAREHTVPLLVTRVWNIFKAVGPV